MKIQRFVIVFALIAMAIYVSCRKMDRVHGESGSNTAVRTKFFNTPPTTSLVVKSIIASIQRQDSNRDFVPRLVKNAGYAIWDKAKISSTQSVRTETVEGQTVIIPFVLENDNTTNAALVVNIFPADTTFNLIFGSQYSQFGFAPDSESSWNAKDIFHLFTKFDSELFGHRDFKILDKRLFPFLPGSDTSRNIFVRFREEQQGLVTDDLVSFTFCSTYDVCTNSTIVESHGSSVCTAASPNWSHEETMCTTIWINNDNTGGSGGSGNGGGSGGGGGTGGGSGNWEEELCDEDYTTVEEECDQGWIPGPNPPPQPDPIDSLLAKYSRVIRDTAIFIYDNLSKPNNIEYAFTGIGFNNSISIIERRTNNDSLQVFPKVMIGNLELLFTWHSHVSRNLDSTKRSTFSPSDIEMLRNVRCLRNNFISFADCRFKRYALVITDVTKATAFFNNSTFDDINDNYTTLGGGNAQEIDERCVKNVIGSNAANGIAFYVSNDPPNFQSWSLLNP